MRALAGTLRAYSSKCIAVSCPWKNGESFCHDCPLLLKDRKSLFEHELQHNARELYNMSVYKEMLKNVDTFMQKNIKPRPRPTAYEGFRAIKSGAGSTLIRDSSSV